MLKRLSFSVLDAFFFLLFSFPPELLETFLVFFAVLREFQKRKRLKYFIIFYSKYNFKCQRKIRKGRIPDCINAQGRAAFTSEIGTFKRFLPRK